MDRSRFGAWGAELDDADFAKALGVMGMHNAVDPWVDPLDDPAAIAERIARSLKGPDEAVPCRYFTWSPEHWSEAYGLRSARNPCTAWDRLRGSRLWSPKLKLELNERARSDPDPAGAGWIVDQLRHPAVGASSVYFGEPARIRNIDWHWPIRIGLLAGEAL